MKYTTSKDGVERCTVVLKLRYTREEMQELRQLAAKDGANLHEWLEDHAALGIEEQMHCEDGAHEQRYGKGCE